MDLHDTLSTLLPPPRDDEPASLRQDILDELGDHLACAYNRELLRGANSRLARQRVLELFGDPAAVARRLWLDAMKGKIMGQRVLIATCLVVTLACPSLVGLVWVQSRRAAAQTNDANRKLAEALAQSQIANQIMLKTLGHMSDAIRKPRSPDWNPVTIKVTEEMTDGPPVAGCSITVNPSTERNKRIRAITDASGVADFGLLHPGSYVFQLSKNGDNGMLYGSGQFRVEPGSDLNKLVICPKRELEPVGVRVRCNWPIDLENEELVVNAPFEFKSLFSNGMFWHGVGARSVLCGPRADLLEIREEGALHLWATSSEPTLRADILTRNLRAVETPGHTLKWERGTYRLSELIALRPVRASANGAGRQRFDVLARCYLRRGNQDTYEFRQLAPTDVELANERNFRDGGTQIGIESLLIPRESWAKFATGFDARPDRVNEWTITLPDQLIKAVRAKLKGNETAKPE
jgi:hypothetical protein